MYNSNKFNLFDNNQNFINKSPLEKFKILISQIKETQNHLNRIRNQINVTYKQHLPKIVYPFENYVDSSRNIQISLNNIRNILNRIYLPSIPDWLVQLKGKTLKVKLSLRIHVINQKGFFLLSPIDKELRNELKSQDNVREMKETIRNFYFKNNFKNLFKKLDSLIQEGKRQKILTVGFYRQAKYILKNLKVDIENRIVVIPALVALIEHVLAERINFKERDKIGTELQKNSKKSLMSLNLDMQTYDLLHYVTDNMWNYSNFDLGMNKVKLTRHSTQHGVANPSRYTINLLIKYISILDALIRTESFGILDKLA